VQNAKNMEPSLSVVDIMSSRPEIVLDTSFINNQPTVRVDYFGEEDWPEYHQRFVS
jgi:hypothetical protein